MAGARSCCRPACPQAPEAARARRRRRRAPPPPPAAARSAPAWLPVALLRCGGAACSSAAGGRVRLTGGGGASKHPERALGASRRPPRRRPPATLRNPEARPARPPRPSRAIPSPPGRRAGPIRSRKHVGRARAARGAQPAPLPLQPAHLPCGAADEAMVVLRRRWRQRRDGLKLLWLRVWHVAPGRSPPNSGAIPARLAAAPALRAIRRVPQSRQSGGAARPSRYVAIRAKGARAPCPARGRAPLLLCGAGGGLGRRPEVRAAPVRSQRGGTWSPR